MCPDGYYLDQLSMDCIPHDTEFYSSVPFQEVTSPKTLTASVGVTKPAAGMNQDKIWIMYTAIAVAAFVVMVMMTVFIERCIWRHKTAITQEDDPAAEEEEFHKLNGDNVGKNGTFFQQNNSNSQALSGIFKDSVIMKVESRNENHPKSCPVSSSAGNNLPDYHGILERKDHGFPLPATELGATVLVTTKTIQIPS
ncbi:uncharacterized protein LOC144508944 [Mustelus asterias]